MKTLQISCILLFFLVSCSSARLSNAERDALTSGDPLAGHFDELPAESAIAEVQEEEAVEKSEKIKRQGEKIDQQKRELEELRESQQGEWIEPDFEDEVFEE